MSTEHADNFAHGTYGDDGGVVFYGPTVKGFWEDRLAVSDLFVRPLFRAVLERAWRGNATGAPKVVVDWNGLTGWADAAGVQELPHPDARDLITVLAGVAAADLVPHLDKGGTPEQYLRCASVIGEFLRDHVDRGLPLYIERD